jgi:hypothetical protein
LFHNKNSVRPTAIGVSNRVTQGVDEYREIDLFVSLESRRVLHSLFDGGGLGNVFAGMGLPGVDEEKLKSFFLVMRVQRADGRFSGSQLSRSSAASHTTEHQNHIGLAAINREPNGFAAEIRQRKVRSFRPDSNFVSAESQSAF